MVALHALSAMDYHRFTLRAAPREQGVWSGALRMPDPVSNLHLIAVAVFWARLRGIANLSALWLGWWDVVPVHPFLCGFCWWLPALCCFNPTYRVKGPHGNRPVHWLVIAGARVGQMHFRVICLWGIPAAEELHASGRVAFVFQFWGWGLTCRGY